MVIQLSVFLENNQGSLKDLTRTLEESGIVIHSMTLADASRFGVVRALVSAPDSALASLQQSGYSGCLTEALAVKTARDGKGLTDILSTLSQNSVDIEYLYMFRGKDDRTALVMGVSNPQKAEGILSEAGFEIAGQEDIG